MTQRQKLVAAAERIEQDGWCQGMPRIGVGVPVCALWAFPDEVNINTPAAQNMVRKVLVAAGVTPTSLSEDGYLYGPGSYSVQLINWNDAEGRTKEEVIRAFRKAARV